MAKRDDSVARTRSQEIARLNPPPAAAPWTAATTGGARRPAPSPAGGAGDRRYHRRVHARHTRDGAVQVGGELLEETGQIFAVLGEILQVAAHAERISRTGEHHRPDAGVLVAVQRGLQQLPAHLQVDGVARPWPVEGNVGDAVANFEL